MNSKQIKTGDTVKDIYGEYHIVADVRDNVIYTGTTYIHITKCSKVKVA